jgi:hypothetical protein
MVSSPDGLRDEPGGPPVGCGAVPVVDQAEQPADRPPDARAPRETTRRRPWWASQWQLAVSVVLGLIVAAPIVVAGIDAAGRQWYPVGDWAMLELRTNDVGGRHTPLLGPYSRYGWNHPGPLLFWLFAVPYRLTGADPSSLLVAAASVNLASVAGLTTFAWRRGRVVLVAAVAVALALVVLNVEPGMVRDPWNPWVTVLPFGLLVMLAWSAVEGDRLALPLAAFVGSFLVHAHVGFLALVVALWAWSVLGFLRSGAPRRPLWWSAGVLGICWLPVVIDLAVGQRNLVDMGRHFLGGDDDPAGLATALGIAARQLGHVAPWFGGDEPPNPFGGALLTRGLSVLIVPLIAFLVGLGLAWWRRAFPALRFQATVALTAVVGVVSVGRVTDEVFNYLVRWWWMIAVLWWVSIAWSVWSALVADRGSIARFVIPIAALCGTVGAAWFSASAVGEAGRAPLPIDDWQPAMGAVSDQAIASVRDRGPVRLESTGPLSGWVFDGLATRLEAAGVPVRVRDEDINLNKYGQHRVSGAATPTEVWAVTGTPIERFAADERFTEVARHDPLSVEDRRRYLAAEAELVAQLRAAGLDDVVFALEQGVSLFPARDHPGIDQALLDEVEELRGAGPPLAVFVTRSDDRAEPAGG